MQFVTSGYVNAFGVYQDFYTREFITNESTSTISWIGSTNNLLVFGGGLIFGRIFDAGYFRSMLAGGSLLFIFCLFMISLTQPNHWYQNFLAQGIGLGAAQGLLYLPSLAVIGQHFEKKRTFVMGIVASGAAVGGIIHPIMLNQLFNGSVGFHNGVRTSAAMNGFLLIVANVLMIRRGVEQEVNHDTPATDPPAKKWYQFFLDPDYGTAVAGNFLFFLGGYFPLFYLQLSAVTHGIDPTLAFYSISIMNAANLPGRLLPNRFASRLGVHNQMIVSAAVCGAFCFLFLVMKNVASLVLIAIIYGFASGAYVSLLAPMLSGLADSVNEIGTRMGTCFAIGGVATFVGPPIMGALLTSKYIWLRPSVFSGACVGAGVLLMIIARHFKIRKLSLRGTPLKRKFVV
ncbi:MFS general substrate transporter [Stereum hirsutum FP-91666 SS1]|uniref:MFS general substrate transporter n=1 Tax=Stereum hirsutum (strain FP-91666) TaxID=721885 RepID=UPI000440AC49|nr:MFS general substrate transporter [Stereum hirsutum FP-91666 SS1]EIM86991.1 MFS general substrate transporter [Stereum hirsutum FP-91666 SS1]